MDTNTSLFLLINTLRLAVLLSFVILKVKQLPLSLFHKSFRRLFGVLLTRITDNISYFTSYSWTKLMPFLNVYYNSISLFHCQANGFSGAF